MSKSIKVEAWVKNNIDKVWESWNSPEHIVKWNHASDDWHTTRANNDLRVGGKINARMEAKDGSAGFDFSGVYTDVKVNERVAYTLDDGRKVSVNFAEKDGGVEVEETFEMESENSEEMQRSGWQAILNNFKAYTEGL